MAELHARFFTICMLAAKETYKSVKNWLETVIFIRKQSWTDWQIKESDSSLQRFA